MVEVSEYIKIITSLLIIVDPVGNVPIFLSVTADEDNLQRKRTIRMTVLSIAVILILAVYMGEGLLNLFGISLAAFRVGAGILFLFMAIAMLHARPSRTKHTPEEDKEGEEKENVAVVPLAIPLLAGPGAISSMIVYTHFSADWKHRLILCLIAVGIAGFIGIVLKMASIIGTALGKTGLNIVTRLMGLILAAIAVEFITGGLSVLLPGLSSTDIPVH